jgi:hypothetical protein
MKHQFLQEPDGVTSQKMAFPIVTALKTSNLTLYTPDFGFHEKSFFCIGSATLCLPPAILEVLRFSDLALYTLSKDHLGRNTCHFLYFVSTHLSARCISTGQHTTYLAPTTVNFKIYFRQYCHLT